MKILITATFAIALFAFGFASITAIPAQAGDDCLPGSEWNADRNACESTVGSAQIDGVDHPVEFAQDDDRFEDCSTLKQNQDGLKLCYRPDEDGIERVAGIELPNFCEDPENAADAICRELERFVFIPDSDWGKKDCWKYPNAPQCQEKAEETEGERVAGRGDGRRSGEDDKLPTLGGRKAGGVEGEQVAGNGSVWDWSEFCLSNPEVCAEIDAEYSSKDFEPVKTASGTFYPLPMIDVASMDKLLAPGGTSVASFDKILAPGGTAVEGDHQFADREDSSGGDFDGSGGGDSGEGDRAAASTAAE